MKICITGSNGLLGQHLVKLLAETTDHIIIATGKGESRLPFLSSKQLHYFSLDITDAIAVNIFLQLHQPDAIIHAAAMTQPDPCQLNPVECWNVNVTATRFLVSAAESINAKFIYISTDFVFDGTAGPYKETGIPNPVNYYGSSKLAAEKAVTESKLSWAIVRTVLLYGNVLVGNRSNIISWVKENLENNKPIKVVSDQWRTPTYVQDICKGIEAIISKTATGIFHLAGKEILSPYEMALHTANVLNLDSSLIEKVTADTFPEPVKRAKRSGLKIDKAKAELSYNPVSFEEGVRRTFDV